MTGARVLGLVDREWPALTTPPEAQEPIRAELFSVERLEQHAESLAAAQHVTANPRHGQRPGAARPRQRPRAAPVVPRARRRRSARSARSRRRRSGWSTTSTSSTSRSARSATICPAASTASSRSSPTGPSRAIRASSAWRGRSSRTPTAASIPRSLRRFVRAYQRVAAAHDRRAVGGRDHAAHRPGREPAALAERIVSGRANRAARRRARRPAARRRRASRRPTRPPRWPASIAARCRAASRCSWCSACATRIRPSSRPALARRAPRGAGHDRRRDRAPRAPAPGRDERDGPQRDHQHAPHVGARLDGVLRERQPGRRGAAARERTSRRWTSPRAIATATRSRSWRAAPSTPSSTSRGAPSRRGGQRADRGRRTIAQRDPGLLPDRAADAARSRTSSASVRDCARLAPARVRGRRNARLPRHDRAHQRAGPRAAARRAVHAGAGTPLAGRVRAPRRSSPPAISPSRSTTAA